MIRSLASRVSHRVVNPSITRSINPSISARSLHINSIYQSSPTRSLTLSNNHSFQSSIKQSAGLLLTTRNFSTKPNVETAHQAAVDQSVSQNIDPSVVQSFIDPSLLDNPVTHAPLYSHTFSQAWEAASSIAFAPTNDHYFPTKAVEFLLDFSHLYTGLPWWATLVAVTVGVRALLLPFSVFQAKHSARLQQMQPEVQKLQEIMSLKRNSANGLSQQDQLAYGRDVKAVMAKHKTNPLYALIGPLATMPIFISFFVGIQAMHEIHPSFTAGGLYHVMDLSMADPYYILPVISSLTLLLPQEILGNTEMQQGTFEKMKWAFRGFAVLMVPLAGTLPSGLFIYWITSNIWTFFQLAAMRMNPIRRVLGLPLLGPDNKPLPLNHTTSQPIKPVQFIDVKTGKITNEPLDQFSKKIRKQ